MGDWGPHKDKRGHKGEINHETSGNKYKTSAHKYKTSAHKYETLKRNAEIVARTIEMSADNNKCQHVTAKR